MAVILIETSMHTCALLGMGNVLHSDFPTDPDAEYLNHQRLILRRLGMRCAGWLARCMHRAHCD